MDEQLKQLGERLRGLRDALDVPMSEMAGIIGIDEEKYERIEKGELDITISNLMKIAHRYGMSVEDSATTSPTCSSSRLSLNPPPASSTRARTPGRSSIMFSRAR